MPISLDPQIHYVTQSGIYGHKLKGPLTDRRIAYYQKRGYYGSGIVLRTAHAKKRKRKVSVKKELAKYL